MFKFLVLFALFFACLGERIYDARDPEFGVTPIDDKERTLGKFLCLPADSSSYLQYSQIISNI